MSFMRTGSVLGLISHVCFALVGAFLVYRGLKLSSQAWWLRYTIVFLGAFLFVISLLLALGVVH
jgi:hypothetical protein